MQKRVIPHIIAIAIFLIISVLYFSPILDGKVLKQHDTTSYKGMSKEITDYRAESEDEPLWTNSMFGGMPSYLISTHYPNNIIKQAKSLSSFRPFSYIFIAALCFYILLLVLKISPKVSVISSIAYALSSYMVIIVAAGHITKVEALGFTPLLFAGMLLTINRGKVLLGGTLLGVGLALQISCNHLQITYYSMMMVVLYGIIALCYAIKGGTIKRFLSRVSILFLFALLGVAVNAGQLLTVYEYGDYSIRGKSELTSEAENRTTGLDRDYATQWSYGKMETLSLMIPNIHGGSSTGAVAEGSELYKTIKSTQQNATQLLKRFPTYWGAQPFTSGPVYIGAIICFLFILGLLLVKGELKWWLLSATILSIVLSWGKNAPFITNLFFDFVPGYNKFRAVSMTLVIAQIAMPLLAALTLQKIFSEKPSFKEIKRELIISLAATGVLSLIIAAIPSLIGNFSSASDSYLPEQWLGVVHQYRSEMLSKDAFRSALFIFATGAVIWLFISDKIKKSYAIGIIALLTIIDLYPVDKRYLNSDNFGSKREHKSQFKPSVADKEILKDRALDYRVLNLGVSTFNDAITSYHHKSIGGYHGAKIRRYQELIDHSISKEIKQFGASLQQVKTIQDVNTILKELPVINMLNTKYIIIDPNSPPIQNPSASGNGWFAEEIKLVDSADEELLATANLTDTKSAILHSKYADIVEGTTTTTVDSGELITLESYTPNRLTYTTESRQQRVGLFSEIYYPKGWKAFIDGKESTIIQANYILRALNIPAGKHKIEFVFSPDSYKRGETISLIASILIIALLIFALFRERKSIKKREE